MTISKVAILAFCILFSHISSAKEVGKKIIIGLIGDSTVADTYGWGQAFAEKGSDQTTVLNYAKNGATLDSQSDELDTLISQKPNFVLIQFGHNDMLYYGANTYSEKLKEYVERVTRSGSKAIVLSSVSRRNFDQNGNLLPRIVNGDRSLPLFARSARAVAKELNVPFVDLNSISMEHHNKIGPEASATYNFEETDTTHFNKKGANAIASLIADELKTVAPELAVYLK